MATDRRRDGATVLTGAGLVAAGGGARHAGVTRALTDRLGREPGTADYPKVHALALKGAKRRPKALYLGGTALGLAGAAGVGTGTLNLLQRKDVGKKDSSLLREGLSGNLEALKGRRESLNSGAPPSSRGVQLAVAGGAGAAGSALARAALGSKVSGRQKALVAPIGAALAATASLPASSRIVQARTRGQYIATPTGVKRAKAPIVRPSSQARSVSSRYGPLRDQVVPSDVRKAAAKNQWWVQAQHEDGPKLDAYYGPFKTKKASERRADRLWNELDGSTDPADNFGGARVYRGKAPWQRSKAKKPVRKSDYLGRRTSGAKQRAAIMGAGATPIVGPLVQAGVSGKYAPPGQERKHAVRQWAMGPGAGAAAGVTAAYAGARAINRNPDGGTARAARTALEGKDRLVAGAKRKLHVPEAKPNGRMARAQAALKTKTAPASRRVMATRPMKPFRTPGGKLAAAAALATVKPVVGFTSGQHAMTLNQRDQARYNAKHPVKKLDPLGRGQSKREKHQLANTKRMNAALSVAGGTAGVAGLGMLAASKGKPRLRGAAYATSTTGTGIGGLNALIHARVQRREASALDPVKKTSRLDKDTLVLLAYPARHKRALRNPADGYASGYDAKFIRPQVRNKAKRRGRGIETPITAPSHSYGYAEVGKSMPSHVIFRGKRVRVLEDHGGGRMTVLGDGDARQITHVDQVSFPRPKRAPSAGKQLRLPFGKASSVKQYVKARRLGDRLEMRALANPQDMPLVHRARAVQNSTGKNPATARSRSEEQMRMLGLRQRGRLTTANSRLERGLPTSPVRDRFGKSEGGDHKKLLRDYGDRGPLPKTLDRETRMRAYEARYAAHGGKKGEKWQRRADVAEGTRNVGLAGATLGGAAWLAARGKHGPKIAARISPRTKHHADTVAVGSATLGGAAELYGEYARNRRASYASSPGGVAASALTRMRANTPGGTR